MRILSHEKYGSKEPDPQLSGLAEKNQPVSTEEEKDDKELTAEQLAELKFGIKWLPIPITAMASNPYGLFAYISIISKPAAGARTVPNEPHNRNRKHKKKWTRATKSRYSRPNS